MEIYKNQGESEAVTFRGIKEAYRDITGKVTTEDIEEEQVRNELDLNEEEK